MRNDDKDAGFNPLEPGEGRDNHPGSDERTQETTKSPQAGSGEGRGSNSGEIGESSRGKGHHLADDTGSGTRDSGHARNYGGYSREAAGEVGDRRNLDDWDVKKRGPRNEEGKS